MKRAVLDTNVMLASQKTASTQSPNAEIVRRWKAGEFALLVTDDLLQEYAEKLIEKGAPTASRRMLLRACPAKDGDIIFLRGRGGSG